MAKPNKRKSSEVSKTTPKKKVRTSDDEASPKTPSSAHRSSGRERKSANLFNISHEEPKHRPKKGTRSRPVTPKSSKSTTKSPKKSKAGRKPRESVEKDYEIEAIEDHRIFDDYYVEYAVRFVGYEEIEWLTEYDLKDAPEILANYKYKVTKRKDVPGEDYTVEEIITHRDFDKKRLYLVQWKGWENPVSHSELDEKELKNCPELLASYKKKVAARKSAKKAKKSTPKSKKSNVASKKKVTRPATPDSNDDSESGNERGDGDQEEEQQQPQMAEEDTEEDNGVEVQSDDGEESDDEPQSKKERR